MDWEIGNVNISVQTEEQKNRALEEAAQKEADGAADDEANPIVDWHTDSYPFVCVIMLSDCTNMIGGETALRKADGSIMKVRGPQMVSKATVVQWASHANNVIPGLCGYTPRKIY